MIIHTSVVIHNELDFFSYKLSGKANAQAELHSQSMLPTQYPYSNTVMRIHQPVLCSTYIFPVSSILPFLPNRCKRQRQFRTDYNATLPTIVHQLPRVAIIKIFIPIPIRIARRLLIQEIRLRDLRLPRSQIIDPHIDHFAHPLDDLRRFALSLVVSSD